MTAYDATALIATVGLFAFGLGGLAGQLARIPAFERLLDLLLGERR